MPTEIPHNNTDSTGYPPGTEFQLTVVRDKTDGLPKVVMSTKEEGTAISCFDAVVATLSELVGDIFETKEDVLVATADIPNGGQPFKLSVSVYVIKPDLLKKK